MSLSRVSIFPLGYMVVAKGLLALLGLLCSLVLWRVYQRLRQPEASLTRVIVTSVVASYALALVWTAADNLVDIPVSGWLLGREGRIRGVFGLFAGSVYNAFTLLAWSLLYFAIKHHDAMTAERERAARAEALAQKAQLEALRYQIHPHFLFNTLNAISTLVADQRGADATRMLARLGDFLRATLDGRATEQVTLAEELEFVQRYVDIEQVRLGERLVVQVDVPPEARPAHVPWLLLQPLVENAIRHGVSMREEGGTVTIQARRDGSQLSLVVADDGPGWAGGPAPGNGNGIGLANTRERLRALYGDRQSLEVDSGTGGARISIRLPFRSAVGT